MTAALPFVPGGNKPGEGPLRDNGQPGTLPQPEENLPSTLSTAAKRQAPALKLMRDLCAGAEAVRNAGPEYLPRAPGEKPENYAMRLARSVYHNYVGRTIEGLTGLVFRQDPAFGDDVPEVITEHWENLDNAGTHGDVFCREVFEDGLAVGHAAILVDYPNTGGARLTLADEAPLRPYWVHIKKDDILSHRSVLVDGQQVLTQVVLRETRTVPKGDFGDSVETVYRVLRNDERGVWYQLLSVTPERSVLVLEEGTYPTQPVIPIVEVPTSGWVGLFESIPPLLDVAYLNVAHYQQWSDYATSIHMTCVPILFGAGVQQITSQTGQDVIVGPNSAVFSPDPAAKLQYTTHDGASLSSCRQALDDLKSDMGTLGLAMLAPQKRSAETAEAKRLDKSTSDSALAVAARGMQDAVEQALIFHARYLGIEDGGSVTINRDFEALVMEADVMNAYGALVRDAGFPSRLVLEMLQRGGRLPEDADLDQLELEMAAERTVAPLFEAPVEEPVKAE